MRDHDPGGRFSAIDPRLLADMIGGLDLGRQALLRVPGLRSEFERYGVDTSAFAEISGIAGWIEHVLPDLRRRQGLAQAMDGSGAPGLVTTLRVHRTVFRAGAGGRAHAGGQAERPRRD